MTTNWKLPAPGDMSQWPSKKAGLVFSVLLKLGWSIKHHTGSHRTLIRLRENRLKVWKKGQLLTQTPVVVASLTVANRPSQTAFFKIN